MNTPLQQAELDGLTVGEFVELQKKKGRFNESAKGFKTVTAEVITADDLKPSAQDLINEVGLNPLNPSYFKNTKPVSESSYYNYSFQESKKKRGRK